MMIWFLLLFTFKQSSLWEKTAQNDHSALWYGETRKPSGFVFSIRIPWFAKWQDLMLHIYSNRTNSKQEKIRIPCRPAGTVKNVHKLQICVQIVLKGSKETYETILHLLRKCSFWDAPAIVKTMGWNKLWRSMAAFSCFLKKL